MRKINRSTIKRSLPALHRVYRWFKRRKNEIPAIKRHLARRRQLKKRVTSGAEKIRVVFICQYIPAWSKDKALFDALDKDQRFEPYLLCVPNRVHANKLDNPEDLSNDAFDYFNTHGYPQAINALTGVNQWFNLKALAPDYVIYNRYDRPMPPEYTSSVVCTYAKVCMIEYGTALLRFVENYFDPTFMANTFCFFSESEERRNQFLRWNRLLSKLRLSTSICCGIPAVENAYLAKGSTAKAWDFSTHSFRAIYAPRWTTDAVWGGSTFLQYKDFFLAFADAHSSLDLLVRPHPLMFQNFIETGLMTGEEVRDFETACSGRPNVRLDQEKEYLATFWNSSVLICDFSSMIIEYYITQKPIIYLTYRKDIEYTAQMSEMLKGCYLVNNEQELGQTLEMLLAGEDPLASVRSEVCNKMLLQGSNVAASENMKQVLIDCYQK